MDKYNIKLHGDSLEKEYADFIQTDFSAYESVWALYIGNRGNDTKAQIFGRSQEQEINRQLFSEHTYTILQSLISLKRIVESNAFSPKKVKSIKEVLDLQDSLLLFFTHLGRISDNLQDASTYLKTSIAKQVRNTLKKIYYKRNVIVHGKSIPMMYKSDGTISIPVIAISSDDPSGWNHVGNTPWTRAKHLNNEALSKTISQLYHELLSITNNIFGEFKIIISNDLATTCSVIHVEYLPGFKSHYSGSYRDGLDAYGLGNFNPNLKS